MLFIASLRPQFRRSQRLRVELCRFLRFLDFLTSDEQQGFKDELLMYFKK